MATKEGRSRVAGKFKKGVGTAKHVIFNPRASVSAATEMVEDTAKKVVASGIKGAVNSASLVLPVKESTRRNLEKKADEWIDDNIANGKLRNLAADVAAFGANTYNQAIRKKDAKFVTRDDVKKKVNDSMKSVSEDLATLKNNGIKENVKQGIVKAATAVHNAEQFMSGNSENMISEEDMRKLLHDKKENIENNYIDPIATIAKIRAEPITDPLKKGAQKINRGAQKTAHGVQKAATATADFAKAARNTILASDAWQNAEQAPISLQPSAILSAPFKAIKSTAKGIRHPINSLVDNIEKLATGAENLQKAKDDKIILKKSGQIVLRTLATLPKGAGKDAKRLAEGTASVFGNMLKNFGESMQQNGNRKQSGFTSWDALHQREEAKKEALEEEKEYFSSLSDKYDE